MTSLVAQPRCVAITSLLPRQQLRKSPQHMVFARATSVTCAWLLCLVVLVGSLSGVSALKNAGASAGGDTSRSVSASKSRTMMRSAATSASKVTVEAGGRIAPLGIGRGYSAAALKSTSLALVVTRCNESLDWLPRLWTAVPSDFRLTRVHVVEKCRGQDSGSYDASRVGSCRPADTVAQLDAVLLKAIAARKAPVRGGATLPHINVTCERNVGLATYGYIRHIVSNYEHLEDYTLFLDAQDPSDDKEGILGYDFCDVPTFLEVARQQGYARLGFSYASHSGPSSLMSHMEVSPLGCQGKSAELLERGPTTSIRGNRFVASRGAVHHTSKAAYGSIASCFESLPVRHRPFNVSDSDWRSLMPGHAQSMLFEEAGHLLFGMPHFLPDQLAVPCGPRRRQHLKTYPAGLAERGRGGRPDSAIDAERLKSWNLWRYMCIGWLGLMMVGQLGTVALAFSLAT